MDKSLLFTTLQQLTGDLKPSNDAETKQLQGLQQELAQALINHPALSVTGNRLSDAGIAQTSQVDAQHASATGFTHIEKLLQGGILELDPAPQPPPAPLVFRRETPFRSNLLGNSVADWGVGMAPGKTFGPLPNEHGLPIWFDFFFPARLVRVRFTGSPDVSLAIPLRGFLGAAQSYKIEPGSVWIASGLIAANPSLAGYFTGLKIRAGSLDLSAKATINSGELWLAPGTTARLNLDLDQNKAPAPSADAGFDATDAVLTLPPTFSLTFNLTGGTLAAGDAACQVFGCASTFTFGAKPAVWISAIAQILIPYAVKTDSAAHDVFTVRSSRSRLCTFNGEAKLDDGSGWLLPAASIDPSSFGQTAGTGALAIALAKGVAAEWRGLRGGKTKMVHPAIIAEPGTVHVVDFFAYNPYGRQKWTLWRNANAKHHSEIVLGFGDVFPLVYVSSSTGSETVSCICSHRDSLDRPVDGKGHPFKVESRAAWAAIVQTGVAFHAFLLDTGLLTGNPQVPTLGLRLFCATRFSV